MCRRCSLIYEGSVVVVVVVAVTADLPLTSWPACCCCGAVPLLCFAAGTSSRCFDVRVNNKTCEGSECHTYCLISSGLAASLARPRRIRGDWRHPGGSRASTRQCDSQPISQWLPCPSEGDNNSTVQYLGTMCSTL